VVESAEGSPLGNIRRYFGRVEELLYGKDLCVGCLLTNTAIELAQHDPEIAALLKRTFAARQKAFRDTLQRAVEAGEIPADANPDKLAAYLLSTLQGAIVSAKAGVPRKTFRDTFGIALSAIPAPAA
jgi:TetR/AcrR family transcriptional repressor of nem operon